MNRINKWPAALVYGFLPGLGIAVLVWVLTTLGTKSMPLWAALLIFVLVWLGTAIYDLVGWHCRKCDARGLWSDSKIMPLSDLHACRECGEYLE